MTVTPMTRTDNDAVPSIEAANEGKHILIYADGSCYGNPGPGGYAAVLRRMDGNTLRKMPKTVGGCDTETTSVRMEMIAAATALEVLKPGEPEPIVIYCDSKQIHDGMTQWLPGWIARGWKGSGGKSVKNRDLWERLLIASEGKTIIWRWVKGHAGHLFNEEVDRLARKQMAKARPMSYGFVAA
ncbi:ribonuclease H family protein [Aminobacter sp. BE322]|uniref:ribonuclease H family protein n=1 Tax=unclassified Aminobacter TaxID=2644704 RepID=UPI003D1E4C16